MIWQQLNTNMEQFMNTMEMVQNLNKYNNKASFWQQLTWFQESKVYKKKFSNLCKWRFKAIYITICQK